MKTLLEFVTVKKELAVQIDGQPYKLIELDGLARDQVMADSFARMSFDKEGKPTGLKNVVGLQAKLVATCLYKVKPDAGLEPVSDGIIQRWPSTVVEGLFQAAQELSGLREEKVEQAAAKNDSGANEKIGSP